MLMRNKWKSYLFVIGLLGLSYMVPASASAKTADDYGRGANNVKIHAQIEYAALGTPDAGKRDNVTLTIERNGKKKLTFKPNQGSCIDCGYLVGFNPVEVVQLNRTREPEVIFNVYSGGAHCCTTSLMYRYVKGKYRLSRHDWGNHPARVKRIRKQPRFKTVDDGFAYVFDSYAGSYYPVQIWKFARRGRLKNVTRRYRGLIEKDARSHEKAWWKARKTGKAAAPLAAWHADQCLLNRCAWSLKKVKRLVRKKGAVREFLWGNNRDYLRTLRKTIKELGYAK